MDNIWIVCIALGILTGVSLGICISLLTKQNQLHLQPESGAMYTYDAQNRLQSIMPMGNFVRLKPAEE